MNERQRMLRARHEATHIAAAKKYGARIEYANLNEVKPQGLPSAHAALVFQLVCGDHNPNSSVIRRILKELPKSEHRKAVRKAQAEARRVRPDKKVVDKLFRDGRL